MYRFDWLEKLRTGAKGAAVVARTDGAAPLLADATAPRAMLRGLSPIVWALGFTSLLTDVASEMVSSVLPAYLFLHLKLSPVQYGIIDGVYNGLAVAVIGLAAGYVADRHQAHKAVALAGYSLSALCRPALILAGGMWSGILVIVGLDRLGKGLRAAPRDAMISLVTPADRLATAFGVHRALDTFGAFLGPLVAVAILFAVPGGYDVIWVASFAFAALGVATLALFVAQPAVATGGGLSGGSQPTSAYPGFRVLLGAAFLVSLTTISDGFVFLLLHQSSGLPLGAFPLYYVAVSAVYMLAAIPAGRLADRRGWRLVIISGYVCLLGAYAGLSTLDGPGLAIPAVVVVLLGLYYAGTEGVLIASASARLLPGHRTRGLAMLAAAIGLGKAASSVTFGGLLQGFGTQVAIVTFAAALLLSTAAVAYALRRNQ